MTVTLTLLAQPDQHNWPGDGPTPQSYNTHTMQFRGKTQRLPAPSGPQRGGTTQLSKPHCRDCRLSSLFLLAVIVHKRLMPFLTAVR